MPEPTLPKPTLPDMPPENLKELRVLLPEWKILSTPAAHPQQAVEMIHKRLFGLVFTFKWIPTVGNRDVIFSMWQAGLNFSGYRGGC